MEGSSTLDVSLVSGRHKQMSKKSYPNSLIKGTSSKRSDAFIENHTVALFLVLI